MRLFVSIMLFGSALIAQKAVAPYALEAGANLPTQSVGPNDLLAVSVYDSPELSRTIRVGGDGYLRLPMLKQRVKADGLFPADLEVAIAKALREEEILVAPFVTVTIAEYHSRPISIGGAVHVPLVFQAEGPTTLLDALARAQGLREDAGREILVSGTSPGANGSVSALTRRINVRSLMDGSDPTLNVRLVGGEIVRVPEAGKIYVLGNVKKPGVFAVQDGSDTTVLEMVALAEGLMPYASKEAYIYRREGAGSKTEIPVPLNKIMKRQAEDVVLAGNDILYVPDNSGRRLAITALEKILLFGAGAGTALIYAGR